MHVGCTPDDKLHARTERRFRAAADIDANRLGGIGEQVIRGQFHGISGVDGPVARGRQIETRAALAQLAAEAVLKLRPLALNHLLEVAQDDLRFKAFLAALDGQSHFIAGLIRRNRLLQVDDVFHFLLADARHYVPG